MSFASWSGWQSCYCWLTYTERFVHVDVRRHCAGLCTWEKWWPQWVALNTIGTGSDHQHTTRHHHNTGLSLGGLRTSPNFNICCKPSQSISIHFVIDNYHNAITGGPVQLCSL